MTDTLPSGVTRETVPRAISTSAIEPSASATGPSGKRNPVASTFISAIPFPLSSNRFLVLNSAKSRLAPPWICRRHVGRDPPGEVWRALLQERPNTFLYVRAAAAIEQQSAFPAVCLHRMIRSQHAPHELTRQSDRHRRGFPRNF